MRTRFVLFCLLVTLSASTACASILSTTGAVFVIPAPANAATGSLESDTQLWTFAERQGVTLPGNILADITAADTYPSGTHPNLSPGTIAGGTKVNSYFIHFDNVGASGTAVQLAGSITFDTNILGIVALSQALNNTDAMPGLPTTIYASSDSDRGLDRIIAGQGSGDIITLSADLRTVTLSLRDVVSSDDLRIITAPSVPEPSTIVLLAAGGLLLLGRVARRRPCRRLTIY